MTKKIYLTLCMLCLSIVTMAQSSYTITGSVVDRQGQPLIGATVIEEGNPSHAVATDPMGQFTLRVTSATSVVDINYAGYVARKLIANSDEFKNPIVLDEDVKQIDAVTVVGYGTLRKSDMTGSVNVVGNDLKQTGMVNSASQMLVGKVAGLQITPGSGKPGEGSQIRIRGGASLNASNNPLVVIDGVPVAENSGAGMSNPLGMVNPNDIESFTVLKDASATAIYGSRGSNGVIIITTKKGAKGSKFKLAYNSDYSVSVNTRQVSTLNGEQYREFMQQYFGDNPNAMALVNEYPDVNTKWQDHIFQPAFGTNQFVSASGNVAGKHNSFGYRASLGYTHQDGTLKGSEYNRYTLDVSLAPRFLDDHLSVDVNIKGTMSDQDNIDGGVVGGAAFFDPTKPIYEQYADNKYNGFYTIESAGLPNSNAAINPIARMQQQYNRDNSYRSIGNVMVDYKMHFLPELRANLNLAYDVSWGTNKSGPQINSPQAWRDADYRGIGRYNMWEGQRSNSLLDFYLNYAKDIKKHRVDVMLGYSWQHFYAMNFNRTFPNNAADMEQPIYERTDKTESYLVSFFGRLNYSFDGRYMITATVRYDGSSRFSPNTRWGLFPSVAVGWNLAQESWLKDTEVNNLKIRASWGITGQQELNTNDYPYMARYGLSNQYSQYQFGDQFYQLLKPDAYDENLKWEETETYNIGLDFAAFQNRLTFSVDYYQKYTKDLLNTTSVPAGSNFSNKVLTNVGDLENKGVEIALGGDIIRTSDWNWNLGLNVTWQDTKITKLTASPDPSYLGSMFGTTSRGTGTEVMIHAVGHSPGSFYVYQQAYDETGKALQNVFVDRNGDGEINDADRYIFGSVMPKVYFGINTTLTYKDWDLSIAGHASFGNKLFNDYRMAHSTTDDAYSSLGFLTNVSTVYQETGFTRVSSAPQGMSDMWIEDASFFRLDNITLGYNFRKLFGAEGLNGRISFTAQNVFTISKYKGLDPENSGGVDGVIWPRPTVYLLGISLNF